MQFVEKTSWSYQLHLHLHNTKIRKTSSKWFKVTFWFSSWRSLSPLKGHLTIPKRSLWSTRVIIPEVNGVWMVCFFGVHTKHLRRWWLNVIREIVHWVKGYAPKPETNIGWKIRPKAKTKRLLVFQASIFYGQIVTTSAEISPKCGLVKGIPPKCPNFRLIGIIVICPEFLGQTCC